MHLNRFKLIGKTGGSFHAHSKPPRVRPTVIFPRPQSSIHRHPNTSLVSVLTRRRTHHKADKMLCCCSALESSPLSTEAKEDNWINHLVFRPPPFVYYRFPNISTLTTASGNQICFASIEKPGANMTLLVSHANAEDLNCTYPTLMKMAFLLNTNVVSYDYSGYGGSTGRPCETNCYADIDCVYEYLIQVLNLAPEQIVLYGRSLGSGPACYLAQRTSKLGRSVAALVLHAPFVSVFRVVVPPCAPTWMLRALGDKFCNVDRVRDITCPIFIAHGEKDSIVPFSHAMDLKLRALAASNKAEIFTSPGMHHNYFESKDEEGLFLNSLNRFLDNHVLDRGQLTSN